MHEEFGIDDIKLHFKNRHLENTASLHDQQIFNDTVVYVCLRKPGGGKDDFEDLHEVAGQVFEYEYPTKKKEEPVV